MNNRKYLGHFGGEYQLGLLKRGQAINKSKTSLVQTMLSCFLVDEPTKRL